MTTFYLPEVKDGVTILSPEESRHAIKVLRLNSGDKIQIIDGEGGFYLAEITEANQKKTQFHIIEHTQQALPSHYIHIAIAPTKNIDRIEWFVEKAVEIGINEISFVLCQNSERKVLKLDRIEKKAISAMKQSMNAYMPKINPLASFNNSLEQISQQGKYIAYVDFDNPQQLFDIAKENKSHCVLIGPEGDFSTQELKIAEQQGFRKVGLGKSRLRTETAGIVACHTLNLI